VPGKRIRRAGSWFGKSDHFVGPGFPIFRSFLVEFQRFRETGLLAFATSTRLFNHAFSITMEMLREQKKQLQLLEAA
jgi:hypothetical protein